MITSIAIDGFKSFLAFELDLAPVTVLTGPSGAGKTNLLDAVALVAQTMRQGFDAATAANPRLSPALLFHRIDDTPSETLTVRLRLTATADGLPLPLVLQLTAERTASGGARINSGLSTISVAEDAAHPLAQALPPTPLDGTDRTGSRLHDLARDVLQAFGNDAPADSDQAIADAFRALGRAHHPLLLWDLAALAGAPGVRITPAGQLEINQDHVGWLPYTVLPASIRTAIGQLTAAASGRAVFADNLGEGLSPDQCAKFLARLRNRLNDARPGSESPRQLLATSNAVAVVAALGGPATGELVMATKATRVGGGLPAASVTGMRPVREATLQEEHTSTVSGRALRRYLAPAALTVDTW